MVKTPGKRCIFCGTVTNVDHVLKGTRQLGCCERCASTRRQYVVRIVKEKKKAGIR